MNFKSSFQRVMCLGNEFDIKKHSMEEIVLATCRSEIVHELNALVSFVSLLFTLFFWRLFCIFVYCDSGSMPGFGICYYAKI